MCAVTKVANASGLVTSNSYPSSKNTPKACPTHNPATSPVRHTQPQPQPKQSSHWTEGSVET